MRQIHEIENHHFKSTDELRRFLKREWSYESKDIDLLIKERYEADVYSDAHETTETTLNLTPDNSGGFTQWYLTSERSGVEYDNY